MECLVTKLKAVVNDDSLRKIGELRVQYAAIESPTPNSQYVGIEIDKSVTLTALGGASFYTTEAFTSMVGEKIFPDNSSGGTWITNGGEFSIIEKYNLKRLSCGKLYALNIEELYGCNQLYKIECICVKNNNIVKGSLDVVKNLSALTFFSLHDGSNVQGNISAFANRPVTTLAVDGCPNVYGAIDSINVSALDTLSLAGTKVSGSIESLVAKLIASGRTTGTITFPFAKTCPYITFEGVLLSKNSSVPANSGTNAFSWTANGTITWK